MASWLGSPTSVNTVPIVVNLPAITATPASGLSTTNLFTTTTTYPAGTYLVGMSVEGSGTFVSSDWVFFRIFPTTGGGSVYPDYNLALVNQVLGTTGNVLGTMCGLLTLSVPSTIVYSITSSIATASKSFYGEGMWLQKVA